MCMMARIGYNLYLLSVTAYAYAYDMRTCDESQFYCVYKTCTFNV